METKIEMILTILADQQTAISDQKAKMSDLQEIVQRQELKIAELESRIAEPSKSNDAQRSLEKMALYRSCEELRSAEPNSGSGGYWIDPDGVSSGDPPIFVQCDMTTGSNCFIHAIFFTDFVFEQDQL